jgi:probable HAF family extracellular repeat protein
MKSIARKSLAGLILLAALAIPIGLAAQNQQQNKMQARYSVKSLGTLGGTASNALGINNKGWANGVANLTGDTAEHATLWRNGTVTDLGTLGGVNSNADFPVKNDKGLIAGFAQTPTVDPIGENFCVFFCTANGDPCGGSNLSCQAFLWRDDVMTPLAMLGGNNSAATGINNKGMIVGTAENNTPDPNCIPPQVLDYEAVIWGPKMDEIHELPAFSGDSIAAAIAINDKGQVVGASGSCGTGPGTGPILVHALLWQDRLVSDLGSLGGALNNAAYAINDRGQVVGVSDLQGDTTAHAFFWQKNVMTDLGTLPGDFSSAAFGINNKGQAVGLSCDQMGNCRAFLWQNGVMTDINSLISPGSSLYLVVGQDINDGGEIVAEAFDQSSGELLASLATPCNGSCWNGAEGTTAPGIANSENPKITLPENVREQLRQRRGFGRFGAGLTRPQ